MGKRNYKGFALFMCLSLLLSSNALAGANISECKTGDGTIVGRIYDIGLNFIGESIRIEEKFVTISRQILSRIPGATIHKLQNQGSAIVSLDLSSLVLLDKNGKFLVNMYCRL